MTFFPLVSRCVCACTSDLGVQQNNKVGVGRFSRVSCSLLGCTYTLDSVVMVHRRVLCLETQ